MSITILDSLLNEFTSINISNPLSPRVIKTVELPIMDIRDIFVRGKYAYLGCEGRSDTASFLIIDPDSMKVVSKLDFKFDEDDTGIRWIYPEAYGICVTDSFALFATTNFGFWTINITNPKIPIKISRFWHNAGAENVVLLDGYVYVVRGWFFYKFETINPAEWKRYIYFDERGYPKEGIKTLRSINSCEIEHPARKIALSKKHAYLAGDYLNIVDLDSLKEAGYYKLPAKANDIAFSEPYIFVTFKSDTLSGLQVYENLLLGKKIRRPYNV